ncbi:MAG: biotin synthase [Burkholderiaceae bacterium]
MSDATNPSLDPLAAARCIGLQREASPWLNEEIAQRMHSRLRWMTQPPKRWAHWLPRWGGMRSHVALKGLLAEANGRNNVQTYLSGSVEATQPQASWLQAAWTKLRGSDVQWQATDQPLDMVWANMVLHLQAQPLMLLQQWLGMLRVNGMLMFSALGPDTLRELRHVYAQMGWAQPTHLFTDMHDWGDMLVQCGFAEPVMDMETLTITYTSLDKLVADLRECGRNLSVARTPHCKGRGWNAQLLAALHAHLPRDDQGNFTLSIEIIYGHALRPEPKAKMFPQTHVSLEDMQHMLRKSKV